MKLSCAVIQDLIPLYVEDMLSEESKQLVEEHLKNCEDCHELVNELQAEEYFPVEQSDQGLRSTQEIFKKRKRMRGFIAVLITLILTTVGFAFLSAPKYLPYEESVLEVSELENDFLTLTFREDVAGFQTENSPSENGGERYHVTAWTTTLNEWFGSDEPQTIVLNPDGESVASLYYYQASESLDQLVYGRNDFQNGGILTLPRLNLFYYFNAVAALTLISLIAILVLKNFTGLVRVLRLIAILGLAYCISHLLIMGLDGSSYHSLRDLLMISLTSLFVFGLFYLLLHKRRDRKEQKEIERFIN